MEHTVLCMLDFKVSVHTSYYFATRLALAAEMTEKEQSFMFFLLGMYDVYFIQTILDGHSELRSLFFYASNSLFFNVILHYFSIAILHC